MCCHPKEHRYDSEKGQETCAEGIGDAVMQLKDCDVLTDQGILQVRVHQARIQYCCSYHF